MKYEYFLLDEAISMILEQLEQSKSKEELDKLRRKYGVPSSGEHVNTGVSKVFNKLKAAGFDRGAWKAPGSQGARLEALGKAKASNWKDGFFLVDNGDLKYPYISASGKAMVSGVAAAARRAGAHGPKKVAEIASAILEKVNAAEKKSKKK